MSDIDDELTEQQRSVIRACEAAESVIGIFTSAHPEEDRVAWAIVIARRWLTGAASAEECSRASEEAFAIAMVNAAVMDPGPRDAAWAASYAAWAAFGAATDDYPTMIASMRGAEKCAADAKAAK